VFRSGTSGGRQNRATLVSTLRGEDRSGARTRLEPGETVAPAAAGRRPTARAHHKILPGIQLLRGLAALLVVLAHMNGMMRHPQYFGSSPLPISEVGGFGVAVFFVISGFIIVLTALSEDTRPAMRRGEFAWRRFVRIVPFMWVCVIGYNLFTFVGTGLVEWLPAARAMVVWPVGELKPNVLWSLRHEFLFYALFAITMLGPRQRPIWLLLWFVAPLVLWAACAIVDPQVGSPAHPYRNELVRVVLLGSESGANLQIGVGFLFGLATVRGHPLMQPRLAGGLWLSAAAIVLGAVIISVRATTPGLEHILLWTALAGAIVYLGIIARPAPGLLQRCGLLLGNASFAIYLVHNPVLLVFLEGARPFVGRVPPIAWLCCAVFAAVIAGIIAHFLVERPLIRFLAGGRRLVAWALPRPAGRR
jgi:exopolysaccharide production protein ExoZ